MEYARLPLYVKEKLTCHCNVDYRTHVISLLKICGNNPKIPLAQYCDLCLKPRRFSVANVVEICEGCDKYYVPRPEASEWPVKHRVCSECDVPARRKRSGTRRRIIVIS